MKNSIMEATDRFVQIAFAENPHIKNLPEFETALKQAFDSPRGENASGQFNAEEIAHFFDSQECKDRLKENVSSEQYDKLYGDGMMVKREVVGKKIITITQPKISIHSHIRAGHKIKAYNKGYKRWTNIEKRFLEVRKAKKLSPKQIIKDYETHFKNNLRSSSSIKTKLFRI